MDHRRVGPLGVPALFGGVLGPTTAFETWSSWGAASFDEDLETASFDEDITTVLLTRQVELRLIFDFATPTLALQILKRWGWSFPETEAQSASHSELTSKDPLGVLSSSDRSFHKGSGSSNENLMVEASDSGSGSATSGGSHCLADILRDAGRGKSETMSAKERGVPSEYGVPVRVLVSLE